MRTGMATRLGGLLFKQGVTSMPTSTTTMRNFALAGAGGSMLMGGVQRKRRGGAFFSPSGMLFNGLTGAGLGYGVGRLYRGAGMQVSRLSSPVKPINYQKVRSTGALI